MYFNMVYRDPITVLIFGVLSFTIIQISTFSGAFVSQCMPEAICCKTYIVYRDLITTLIICVLHFTIIPIYRFSGAFVTEIR